MSRPSARNRAISRGIAEYAPQHRDLGQLERDSAAAAHHLLRQGGGAHEIASGKADLRKNSPRLYTRRWSGWQIGIRSQPSRWWGARSPEGRPSSPPATVATDA